MTSLLPYSTKGIYRIAILNSDTTMDLSQAYAVDKGTCQKSFIEATPAKSIRDTREL